MAKKNQSFNLFPTSTNLEALVGKNLQMESFEYDEGQQGTYLSLKITDLDTGERYLAGTRATIVMKQLDGLDPITACPFSFSISKNNKSFSLVSLGDGTRNEPDTEETSVSDLQ